MKPLAVIFCLCLASCAPVPRAIIPPPSVIAELDVAPVAEAGKATREAVRKVSISVDDASQKADRVSDEALRLKEAISKARAGVKEDMELSLAAADAIADALLARIKDLQESLRLTAIARDIAIETVDDQQEVIGEMAAAAEAQTVQIRHAKDAEATLRTQVEALAESADKRVIAEDRLAWWRKAALITWAVILIHLIVRFFGTAILTAFRIR
jgi:hypothetical protein